MWKLHVDWRQADPDPQRRHEWARRERLGRHLDAFRGRITEGFPHDPRRLVDFTRLVSPILPTFIKLLWLQRMFYWYDFLHLTPRARENRTAVLGGSIQSEHRLPSQEGVLSACGAPQTALELAAAGVEGGGTCLEAATSAATAAAVAETASTGGFLSWELLLMLHVVLAVCYCARQAYKRRR